MSKLSEFLKQGRLKLNYTQEYVAEKLGVSSSSVSRWEKGEVQPSIARLERYVEFLGFSSSIAYAILASEEIEEPRPIAEIKLEVYSKEAYDAIMKVVGDLGVDVTIESKRLRKWT